MVSCLRSLRRLVSSFSLVKIRPAGKAAAATALLAFSGSAFAGTCFVTSTADTTATGTLRACAASAQTGDTIDLSALPPLSIITLGSELDLNNPVTVHGRTDGGVTIYGAGGGVTINNSATSGTYTYNHLVLHSVELLQGNGAALVLSYSTMYGVTGVFPAINGSGAVTITHSSVVNNPGGGVVSTQPITVIESTVYGNAALDIYAAGSTVDVTRSIVGVVQGLATYTNSYHGSAPQLGPLQLNGSLFPTMLPLVGSPVIGIAPGTAPDERGYPGKTVGDAGAVQTHYITVTAADTTAGAGGDPVPADTTTGSCAEGTVTASCTLREAVNYANAQTGTDITFAPSLTATATTAAPATITLGAALTAVKTAIDMAGPGANLLQISGAGAYRIAAITETIASLTFNGLTATMGYTGNTLPGGGAFLNQGTLTLETSAVTASQSGVGGGGIFDDITSSVLYVHNSTISGNRAANGGGVIHEGLAEVLVDSTLSGNTALNLGGAAVLDATGNKKQGAAGVCRLTGVTAVNNTAQGAGGAFFVDLGSPLIANSVVEGNTSVSYPDMDGNTAGGAGGYIDGGGNLINTSQTATSNPVLGPLQYNGGTTQTQLPLPGSPAICAGTAANGLQYGTTNDQRGGTHSTAYCAPTVLLDAGAVQTSYSAIQFVQQPSDVLVNDPNTPAPTVSVTENGMNAGGIPLTLLLNPGTGLSGGTATTVLGGVATFSALTVSTAGSADQLNDSLRIPPAGYEPIYALTLQSNPFRVLATPDATLINYNPNFSAMVGQSNPTSVYVQDTVASVYVSGTVTVVNTTTHTTLGPVAYNNNDVFFDLASSTAGPNVFTISFAPNAGGAFAANSVTFTVNVTATPSATNSTLTAAPLTLPAGAASTASATVRDASGNLLVNVPVTFFEQSTMCTTTSGGGGSCNTVHLTQSGTTDMNGVARVSVTAIFGANLVSVSATAASASFGSVNINFVAPAYVVTVATDTTAGVAANCVDPNVSTAGNTNCSLRDAIAASNALGGVSTAITFAPALTATATTATPTTITLNGTQLELSQSATITGPGANLLQIFGNGRRILQVDASSTATLSDLTFTAGYINSAGANNNGGAVNNLGSLTLLRDTFVANKVTNYETSAAGGAVASTGALTVVRCTFSGNTVATGYFSGVYGGAIASMGGSLSIIDSTFSGNSTLNSGSASDFEGGAVYTSVGATITSSTFAGNSSLGSGGALSVLGTTSINNSLFSASTSASGGEISGTYTGSGNVMGLSATAAQLSGLGYYGGTTQTILPLPGSPALCAGLVSVDGGAAQQAFTDQRGAVHSTSYCTTAQLDAGAVQTSYALAIGQQPSNVLQNAAMSPAPTVSLTENGLAFTAASVTIPLTQSGTGTISGNSAATSITTGLATYPALKFGTAQTGDTLAASLLLNGNTTISSATSSSFNVIQATTQLAFGSAPAATVTAGSNAGPAITVKEEDASGNTVASAADTITLTVTGPSGYSKTYTATAANGVATFNLSAAALTAAGSYTYTASFTGLSSASSNETVVAATASKVTVVSGSGQSAAFFTAFAAPLKVLVTDAYGNLIGVGAAVTFTAPASGASTTFSAMVTTGTDSTASTSETANGQAGTYSVTASVPAGTQAASFSLTNNVATPTVTVNSPSVSYGTASTTLTAMIAYTGSTSPKGGLTFTVNGSATGVGAVSCSGTTSPLTCTATYNTSSLTVNSYAIKATEAADTNYSTASGTGTLTVTQITPTVTVTSSSVSYGTASTTLTAMVAYTGSAAPTGGLTFTVNGSATGVGTVSCTGSTSPVSCTATYNTSSLTVNSYATRATEAADINYATSSGTGILTVTQITPTVTVTSSSVSYGTASTTLTAMVAYTGSAAPTGGLTFTVNGSGTGVGTVSCTGSASPVSCTATYNTSSLAVNSYAIKATEAADTNYAAASGTGTLTITQIAPSITFAVLNPTYGDAPFAVNATSNSTGAFTYMVVSGPATIAGNVVTLTGAGTVTLQASEAADTNYLAGTKQASFSVAQEATTTTVSLSSTSINPNQTVTITGRVSAAAGGPPTGMITFLDNGTTLQTLPLLNGATSFTTSLSPATQHFITITYSGGPNFLASSGSGSAPVTVASLDFTFTDTGSQALTVAPGTVAAYTFSVSALYGSYSGPVSFTVTGLPAGATATFTPSSIAANGGPQTVVMSIQTPQPLARNETHSFTRTAALFALLLLPFATRRKLRKKFGSRFLTLLVLAGGVAGAAGLTGCGTGNGFLLEQPATYTLTVTASSLGVQHSQTVTLTVQ